MAGRQWPQQEEDAEEEEEGKAWMAEAACQSALPRRVATQSLDAANGESEKSGWHRKPHLNPAVRRNPEHLTVSECEIRLTGNPARCRRPRRGRNVQHTAQ